MESFIERFGLLFLKDGVVVSDSNMVQSTVVANPPFFCGLAGHMAVPGTYTLEVMCQTGALIPLQSSDVPVTIVKIDDVRFSHAVPIGATIVSSATLVSPCRHSQWTVRVIAKVDKRVVSHALVVFHQIRMAK